MTDARREALIIELGEAMSEVSEECYCAGWLIDTETIVPALCREALATGAPQRWGMGRIDVETAARLVAMADELGCWVTWSMAGYIEHRPEVGRG